MKDTCLCHNFVLMYMHLRVENGDRKIATKFAHFVLMYMHLRVENGDRKIATKFAH